MTYNSSNIKALLFLVCILSLGSCNVSKYLTENQYLVKKNKVIIADKSNSADDSELVYNLEALIIQKPNTNHNGTPRELIYFRNKEEFENSEEKKGRLREAQRPVIHDDELMRQSAERMEKYLRNSKGFYFAKVTPSAFLSQKRAEVTYTVTTDSRYTVRSKEYFYNDPQLKNLIDKYEPGTLIKPGSKIDESVFEAEKTRIFTKLQNKGYAAFSKNFIEFKADSSDMQMDIFVRILPPPSDEFHKKYNIGKIKVYPNYRGIIDDNSPFKTTYKDVEYEFTSEKPYINAPTLHKMIKIKEGDQYKKRNVDATYSSLSKIGTYRYINITSEVSKECDDCIDYNIFLTPIDNIWAFDASINLFYTFLGQSATNNNRLGISAITSLTNINTFGGGEKLRLSAETTTEILIPNLNFNQTFNLQSGLNFPILVDYKNIVSSVLGTLNSDDQLEKYKNNTTTSLFASYGFERRTEQYTIHGINASLSYEYRPDKKFTYIFTPFNINSYSSRIDSSFRADFLDNNPALDRSFDDRFLTTFVIPQLLYQMSSPVFSSGFNWNLKINSEISGLEILGINGLYNWISNSNNLWAIDLGQDNIFEFSRFILLDADVNATQKIGSKHSIAGRFHTGIAIPFLQNDVIPYIRQFSVGGVNSIRAWQFRELGPGGFEQTVISSFFVQTGDVVLEASFEYRFPILFLEGAVFLDAGNVWALREDSNVPDGNFTFNNFYNQIAIGTGFGLRWDLDFLVLRVDLGYRLRSPFEDPDFKNGYWYYPDLNYNSVREYLVSPILSFGLNYPF